MPLQSKYDNEAKKEDKKVQEPAKATKKEKPSAKKPNKIVPRNRFDPKPQSRAGARSQPAQSRQGPRGAAAPQKSLNQDKSLVALYKSTNKEGEVKYQKVKATISKPQKPLVKTFYEQYWTDKRLVKQNLDQGKILEGRLFFD